MVESQDYRPFHLSELNSALATLEAHNGGMKKAKRFYSTSLIDPSENAIAQAAWLGRNHDELLWTPLESNRLQSSEANAWAALRDGRWTAALSLASQWQAEEPFSSRPAILGGYIASTAFENFNEAERMICQGLVSNSDDAMLHNNLAFVLAKQGKIDRAKKAVEFGIHQKPDLCAKVCLTATQGLIAFRSEHPEEGRMLYILAINIAKSNQLDEFCYLATIHRAIEEIRIGSKYAMTLFQEGLDACEKLSHALPSLFRDKLHNAMLNKPHS